MYNFIINKTVVFNFYVISISCLGCFVYVDLVKQIFKVYPLIIIITFIMKHEGDQQARILKIKGCVMQKFIYKTSVQIKSNA